jgi:hypothetical protein
MMTYVQKGWRLAQRNCLSTTDYLLDREEIAGLDGSGNILRRDVPGTRTDEKIIVAEGSSLTAPTCTYFHVNHQGSVMRRVGGKGQRRVDSEGGVRAAVVLDPWGSMEAS